MHKCIHNADCLRLCWGNPTESKATVCIYGDEVICAIRLDASCEWYDMFAESFPATDILGNQSLIGFFESRHSASRTIKQYYSCSEGYEKQNPKRINKYELRVSGTRSGSMHLRYIFFARKRITKTTSIAMKNMRILFFFCHKGGNFNLTFTHETILFMSFVYWRVKIIFMFLL